MENQLKENIESLFEKTGDYIETRVDLYKLKAVDKSSDILSSLVSKIIVLVTILMFIVLLNIGIALFLGDLLGKSYYGFLVLAGVYLITGLFFHYNQKNWFKKPFADSLIQSFLK